MCRKKSWLMRGWWQWKVSGGVNRIEISKFHQEKCRGKKKKPSVAYENGREINTNNKITEEIMLREREGKNSRRKPNGWKEKKNASRWWQRRHSRNKYKLHIHSYTLVCTMIAIKWVQRTSELERMESGMKRTRAPTPVEYGEMILIKLF